MSYLLHTNLISELARTRPDSHVVSWLKRTAETRLFLSAPTIAELARGVERLPSGKRRSELRDWLRDALLPRFKGRILPFDEEAALEWGRLMGAGERTGRTPPDRDCQIAAIARVSGLTIATRNGRDFVSLEVEVFDPWMSGR